MSTLLSIDTATGKAQVSAWRDGSVLHALYNDAQKDHAAFLQPALQQLLKEADIDIKEINAVAVNAGPGSYTGLRVGMASAKGLCYALDIPLITLNGLELLTASLQNQLNGISATDLFCPMIDARRMEVFTAVYDAEMKTILEPCAMILDENSFKEQCENKRMFFFGNGSGKFKTIFSHPNACFENTGIMPAAMGAMAGARFEKKQFADLSYSEPFYIKEFQAFVSK
jgi:tRNA threonylcarbamoyladenosine biosynthesis protein TsaB